jgi:hypothetical protein
MSRVDHVETLALSAAFAGIATVATVSLGHHVAELFSALAMGFAILGLAWVSASAARGTGWWRPSSMGPGFDAAGLLAAVLAALLGAWVALRMLE